MNLKQKFLDNYRTRENDFVTMHFCDDEFIARADVKIVHKDAAPEELNDIYVQAGIKDGIFDARGIEEREVDVQSCLINLRLAKENPKKWNLDLRHRVIPEFDSLRPIPIAKDTKTGKELILDSNHLLVNTPKHWVSVPIVWIIGPNLENVIRDYRILNYPKKRPIWGLFRP